MPKFLVKILAWILETKAFKYFARNILSEWTLRGFGWPKLKGSSYWKIKETIEKSLAEKGDSIFVFCSVDRKMVSYNLERLLIGSKWSHAGFIFIDPNNSAKPGELSIKHINAYGFVYEPLQDYLNKLDAFCLCRLPVSDIEEARRRFKLIEKICSLPGENFDYDYSIRLEPELIDLICNKNTEIPENMKIRIYCSEFVYLVGKDIVTDPNFKEHWFEDRYLFAPDRVYISTERLLELE